MGICRVCGVRWKGILWGGCVGFVGDEIETGVNIGVASYTDAGD